MSKPILEQNKRLSESILWEIQEKAYIEFGPEAWTQKNVPFHITSNPLTARQYAHLVLAYIKDCLSPTSPTPIERDQPIYIFDLGAGAGRFSYLFLKILLPIVKKVVGNGLKLTYVMTDIAERNLKFCREHSYLKEYIKEGLLDFAYYHHSETNESIHLSESKKILTGDSVKNPIILIANYFFDTIPQDLFRVKNKKIQEGRITIQIEGVDEIDMTHLDPLWIEQMQYQFSYYPIDSTPHYYPTFSKAGIILEQYQKKLEESPFLFPIGALQVIQFFSKLSNNKMLLIGGDQGVCTLEQLKIQGEPKISKHATFSIPVNYHALSEYFHQLGGVGFLTSQPDPLFVVLAGVVGGREESFPETGIAFQHCFDAFEPKDYWKMVDFAESILDRLSLEGLLIILKLGNFDPITFNSLYHPIRNSIKDASPVLKEQLVIAIEKTLDYLFPIAPEEGDFVLNLGVLLYDMKRYSAALKVFQRSLEIAGKKRQILINMGACYLALQDVIQAKNCFDGAKKMEEQ